MKSMRRVERAIQTALVSVRPKGTTAKGLPKRPYLDVARYFVLGKLKRDSKEVWIKGYWAKTKLGRNRFIWSHKRPKHYSKSALMGGK